LKALASPQSNGLLSLLTTILYNLFIILIAELQDGFQFSKYLHLISYIPVVNSLNGIFNNEYVFSILLFTSLITNIWIETFYKYIIHLIKENKKFNLFNNLTNLTNKLKNNLVNFYNNLIYECNRF
jgi:hypothetical protein